VVDFIDLQWWPIFNVADIGVTVGGALLLLTSVFDGRPEREPAGEESAAAGDRVESP
jgi:signal peptidase II